LVGDHVWQYSGQLPAQLNRQLALKVGSRLQKSWPLP
jgi:hypothetical protein